MKKLFMLGILLALCALPSSLLAIELSKLQINGFVSQGYLKSNGNNYFSTDSQDGTFQMNEIGLTFNMPVSNKLRVGTQFLSRDLGPSGNNAVVLDWAFGDYRFSDWFGVRAGKLKLPIGLYNETRDSDFLRPMAFLPQSIYEEMLRGFMSSGFGGSVYGNISAGNAGDFDYQLFYGQTHISDDDFLVETGLKDMGMNTLVSLISSGLAGVDKVHYEPDSAFAASLIYTTPLEGLRLGASYFKSKGKFTTTLDDSLAVISPEAFAALNTLDFDVTANISPLLVFSLEYAHPLFTISSEYMEREQNMGPLGLANIIGENAHFWPGTSMGWYVMATAQIPQIPGLSVSALYDEYYTDKDDKSETNPGDYHKTIGIGTRYDITPNWLVKLEWHAVEGAGGFSEMLNNGPLDDDWSYVTVKTSYNF